MNVFANPERLNLTAKQRGLWLTSLLAFLEEHPTTVGTVLLGKQKHPWRRQDVLDLERVLVTTVDDRKTLKNYLAILRSAAHSWSLAAQQKVALPRVLNAEDSADNPFNCNFADVKSDYARWKHQITEWCRNLFNRDHLGDEQRELLLSTFVASAVLHGGVLGLPFLVALLRAIANKRDATFAIAGRIYVECVLTPPRSLGKERRLWIPDALSALLWDRLRPEDVAAVLSPQLKYGTNRPPSDGHVYQRIERLFRNVQSNCDNGQVTALWKLRKLARVIQLTEMRPFVVSYCDSQLTSNALARHDVRRLFPGDALYEAVSPATSMYVISEHGSIPGAECSQGVSEWRKELLHAVRAKSARESLDMIMRDASSCPALKLFSGFVLSLLSSTPLSGKPWTKRRIMKLVGLISLRLGKTAEQSDLSSWTPDERLTAYLKALNEQPEAGRKTLLLAIFEFDAYLVAQCPTALPVNRSRLPWLSKTNSVDVNFATHREYAQLLDAIAAHPFNGSSERRRQIARLVVVLAFRCGLRRYELRRLRLADLLMRAYQKPGMEHLLELHVRPRPGDPLKTRNAVRRINLGALLSPSELQELYHWYQARGAEVSSLQCHLFALSTQEAAQLPVSFFKELNIILRQHSTQTNRGSGIHLHALRHSSLSWLLLSLLSQDGEMSRPLFPDLTETNAWLADSRTVQERLLGSTLSTRKLPFLLARIAGHSSFQVSASSYIHFFPWITAAALDSSPRLQPDEQALRLASGLPDSTFRRRIQTGGAHHLAFTAYIRSLDVYPGVPHSLRDERNAVTKPGWLYGSWSNLRRASTDNIMRRSAIEMNGELWRANKLKDLMYGGIFRHAMERVTTKSEMTAGRVRLACPLKPVHRRNIVPVELQLAIQNMHREDASLLQDALQIFTQRAEADAFVRFDSPEYAAITDRYIAFLMRLGLQKRKIELISGDVEGISEWKLLWRNSLAVPNLLIQSRGPSSVPGPKSALFIRPNFDESRTILGTGPAGFHFLMAMAYIVYGTDGPQSSESFLND